jgi:hypothetical protein
VWTRLNDSEKGPEVGSCEHSNELSGTISLTTT